MMGFLGRLCLLFVLLFLSQAAFAQLTTDDPTNCDGNGVCKYSRADGVVYAIIGTNRQQTPAVQERLAIPPMMDMSAAVQGKHYSGDLMKTS
jgi:hypothetical protein